MHGDDFDGNREAIGDISTQWLTKRAPQERSYAEIVEYYATSGQLLRRETRSTGTGSPPAHDKSRASLCTAQEAREAGRRVANMRASVSVASPSVDVVECYDDLENRLVVSCV